MENKMNQKTMMGNGVLGNVADMYLQEFLSAGPKEICKAEADGIYMFNGCYISLIYMLNHDVQGYLNRQLCRYNAKTNRMLIPIFNEFGGLDNFLDPDTGNLLVSSYDDLIMPFLPSVFDCKNGVAVVRIPATHGGVVNGPIMMQQNMAGNMPVGNVNMSATIPNPTNPVCAVPNANNINICTPNIPNMAMPARVQMPIINGPVMMHNPQGPIMQGNTSSDIKQFQPVQLAPIQTQPVLQGCLNPMSYNNSPVQLQGYVGGPINVPTLSPAVSAMSYDDMLKQVVNVTLAIDGLSNTMNMILDNISDIKREQVKANAHNKFYLPLENGPKLDKLEAEVLKNKRLKEEGSNSKIKNYMDFPESFKNGEPHDPFLKEILKIKEDDKKSEDNDKSVDNKHTGNK